MKLSVTAKGADGRRLDLLADRARDPRPAFSTIADKLMAAERRLFNTGRGWPPDKPATRKRKAKKGLDPRTLHATGAAALAFTVRGAPGQKLEIDRAQLVFGIAGGRSPVFYMRFQKHRGRDPLVSRGVVTAAAKPVLREFLTGR